MLTRTVDEWTAQLNRKSVPAGPINTIAQAFEHPQVKHRQMRVDIAHPLSGSVPSVASPIRMSASPMTYDTPPPTLGQHTDEVLASLCGMRASDIEALRGRAIV